MASLFLGKIGTSNDPFEIHAVTVNLPFREFSISQISDSLLADEIFKARHGVLAAERPIYCTAISPDNDNKKEINPHDLREGTVHFVALNKKQEVSCALSVAIDIGELDNGKRIGLPLENRWKKNGYSEGQNLDEFRKKYLAMNHGEQREFKPWELAELYRHFKSSNTKSSLACRLGLYTACYHLLVREARKKKLTPTPFWTFDAIPTYFNLYKYAGAAVLRDPTIQKNGQLISPSPKEIKEKLSNGHNSLYLKEHIISRIVQVPIPYMEEGSLKFKLENTPFLDGIVDILNCEKAIKNAPLKLKLSNISGVTLRDRIRLRHGLSIIGNRVWQEDLNGATIISKKLNAYMHRKLGATIWMFNSIGSKVENEI